MHYNIIETGKRIKELRRKRGLTQKKLAEMIGMAPNSIAKIENGVVGASIDALLIMCQILNTDLDVSAKYCYAAHESRLHQNFKRDT